jgi:hypothetical protein
MDKKKFYFLIELFTAIILISAAILWMGRISFFASDNLYFATTDAIPHYTKVEYIAQCVSQFQWPSWFPYWYCGSAVMQYYPPLSFLLLVPLELIFNNATISLKIFIFLSLLIGGMGIWYTYYRYIGRCLGILAAILYVAQPYFIISLLGWGVIAQAPILAIAPWHLILSIDYFKNPRLKTWLVVLILTLLMLLSHVMHGFMIVLCIITVMFMAGIIYRKGIGITFMWGIATALAAGLLGMWWVPGVLPLENPGLPYLLPESAMNVTANWTWFVPWADNTINAYFSASILILSILSFYFVYRDKSESKLLLWFLYALTGLTLIFSFGVNMPLFKYLPLAKSLVPGRIITETAIGASILSVYLLGKLISNLKVRPLAYFVILTVLAIILYDYKSFEELRVKLKVSEYSEVEKVIAAIPNTGTNFEKGRFAWSAATESIYTYFPRKYDLNIMSGWNIEGTPHNQYLWFQNSALVYGGTDYVIKKMNDMNVRSYYWGSGQNDFYIKLENEGFHELGDFDIGKLLYSSKPSSYFMKQERNTIAIGKSVSTFAMAFPWVVEGSSKNIKDYNLSDFEDYSMIIFVEPEVKNIWVEKHFEALIKDLARQGKTVFIEMGREYFPSSILGVSFIHYEGSKDAKIVKAGEENEFRDFYMPNKEEVIGLTGLDEVYYSIKQNSLTKPIDLIGAKYVDDNKIYIIGGPLSQLLSPSIQYLTGLRLDNDVYKNRDASIQSALEDVFANQPHYTSLSLPVFETKNTVWDYKGCNFEYSSNIKQNVMISVTYTPRWQVKVDGLRVKTKRVDNMLCVDLPPGFHRVEMYYGITWVGMLGWIVTFLSLVFTVIAVRFYKKGIDISDIIFDRLLVNLEIKRNKDI